MFEIRKLPLFHVVLLASSMAALAVSIGAPVSNIDIRRTGEADLINSTKPPKSKNTIRFGRDIRPLLADRCFKCHGGDANTREANLRFDERESATGDRKGKKAIVPGKLNESEMWRRITSDDKDEVMPPPTSNKKSINEEERELIREWIEDGAGYEPHWSFAAPVRSALPEVKNKNWARNEIDTFILAKLESEGIAPSEEASKEAAIRRLYLDITGLPPAPEETLAFVNDPDSNAYEKWVDKLLNEEPYKSRYAERMAAPWLDAARFADTCGIHTDAGRSIWPWRDWVLKAFRDNVPFDTFTIEQIAGDLLPNATRDQKIASGFNRNHVTTDEGGAIAEEYLVEYAVDRVATTGSVFLGLTLGCARCHDHKFDPVSQKEFYQFYAFYNSIEEPGLYSQLPDAYRAHEPNLRVPSPEQEARLETLQKDLAAAKAAVDAPLPGEDAKRLEFINTLVNSAGLHYETPAPVSATSAGGAVLTIQPDKSILASGANPARDEQNIIIRTQQTGLRTLLLEALADASLPAKKPGRAPNGNAVLTGVEADAVSLADPTKRKSLQFFWAWADHEQPDGDHRIVNILNAKDGLGWAIGAHQRAGGRVAVLVTNEPFGFAGGTELKIKLQYNSMYDQHVLGRVRLSIGKLNNAGLARLPMTQSDWYRVGPFPTPSGDEAYNKKFGPESDAALDLKKNFGAGNQYWTHVAALADGALHTLPDGVNATFVARRVFAAAPQKLNLSLGSDDSIQVYVNGKEAFAKRVDRGLAPDQDKATIELRAGENIIVLKIVNVGGEAGFYYKPLIEPEILTGDLMAALLPEAARGGELNNRLAIAWKLSASPEYRKRRDTVAALDAEIVKLNSEIPLTMIMKELEKPRETFVLTRGLYDHPDKAQPVSRAVPAAFGILPKDAPANRLGLAKWLVAPENPLVARVAVNRFWELFFGVGIVKTSDDFGLQSDWPSHPELLDWLAVEFRESKWNIKQFVKKIVMSAAYRQSSRVRRDVVERDPENRLLSYFPRRRLSAEQIRDQVLYISGLLVERLGGPSVKPYQPAGLWEEVAMPASNTRNFQRDNGQALYRRSLYTYWKRAAPPPSMLTLDAPTREFCITRRTSTNTPLQALVLWNDEQFVEAARKLTEKIVAISGNDTEKIGRLFQICAGRAPDGPEFELLKSTLAGFRERYRNKQDDAKKLLTVGASPATETTDHTEFASWMMLANAVLSLDITMSRY
ncbi:MAG: PSD1 and planctomycete cytochrome C domain-containing protein [Planctomycetota bacterium]